MLKVVFGYTYRCSVTGSVHHSLVVLLAQTREHEHDEDETGHERDEGEHNEHDSHSAEGVLRVVPLFWRITLLGAAVAEEAVRTVPQIVSQTVFIPAANIHVR